MSTAAALMTAEEFAEFCRRPENAGRRLELEDGEVVEMPSPGEMHGVACWLIAHFLGLYLMARRAGYLCTNDTGLIVARDPDTVRGPDVMVFLTRQVFGDLNRGHVERVPEVVVEVFSPTDRAGRLVDRVELYHDRGVREVWVIFPQDRTVNIFRPGVQTQALDEGDEIDGGAVLPGFRVRVADLFTLPGA